MDSNFTAVIQKDGNWWIGWVEEVPGANAQEATREDLLESLGLALKDILELNRQDARKAMTGDYEEVQISA